MNFNAWPAAWRWLAALVMVRLALSMAVAWVVPPWEAYDEDGHFAYARYVAMYGRLPQPGDPNAEAIWSKFQPPLYYLLTASILWPFNLGAGEFNIQYNPFFTYGDAGWNYAIQPQRPTPAEQRIALALRAGRMASALIGAFSVIPMFAAARLVWPRSPRRALTATALFALWPQAVFHGGVMTNDGLVGALAALVLYLAALCWRHGLNWRRVLGLALFTLLASLTKLNGLGLVALALGGLMLGAAHPHTQSGKRRGLALMLLSLAVGVAALGSLQFVTEQVFNLQTLERFWNHLPEASQWLNLGRVEYGLKTFWAVFGWGNVEVWPVWYGLAGLMAGLAGLGGLPLLFRRGGALGWLLVTQITITLGLSAGLMLAQRDPALFVGRYWLPALPCVVLALTAGLNQWRTRWALTGAVWLTAWTTWSGVALSVPAVYAVPLPATSAQLETLDTAGATEFANGVRLLGWLPGDWPQAGAPWAFSLCWQANRPIDRDYPVALTLQGADNQGHGRLTTYHGRGAYPTRQWLPNQPFCDRYDMDVWPSLPMPARAILQVALLDPDTYQPVSAVNEITGLASPFAAVPVRTRPVAVTHILSMPAHYTFNGQLTLTSYTLAPVADVGRTGVQFTSQWQAHAPIKQDYVIYLHLRDTPTSALAIADGPPRGGDLPTYWWQTGETLTETRLAVSPWVLAPTVVDVYVGVYDAQTRQRLPVTDAQGRPQPNNEVRLAAGWVLNPLPTTRLWLPLLLQPGASDPPLPAYP